MRDEASLDTGYTAFPLDRRAEARADAERISGLRDRSARGIVIAGEKAVLKKGQALDALFALEEAASLDAETPVFLGTRAAGAVFAGRTPHGEEALKARGLAVVDLRSLAIQGAVPPDVLSMLGAAKSVLTWHATHPFCARCGAATEMVEAGFRRDCPSCKASHFPRTDPVVIMMVVRGERCLLARKAQFLPGMHSCIAGFVEPGETIEDAVRRETVEEVGLRAGRVRYHASQPWPLPFSQLMIGCYAEALDETIVLEAAELEAGRWFTRAEARAILDGVHPEGITCPPRAAIAHLLMRDWVEGRAPL